MMVIRDGRFKSKALSLCLILGVLATGCDESKEASVEEHLKRAQELLKTADFRGSVVELKNVLQADPNNADARLILSQVYAETGDGESAEKEILRARELGMKGAEVMKALGRAYILTRKFKQILEDFTVEASEPASRQAAIFLLRGDAYYGLGKNIEAETAFDKAIEAYRKDINEERPHLKLTELPEFVAAIVGKTLVSIRRRNWTEANKRLSFAFEVSPENPEVLAAKGEITFKQEEPAASEKAYAAAFEAKPYNLEYQVGIARAQIALKKFDEAITNLDAVRKHFPNHIISNQYRALAALQSGDNETAKQFADAVLKIAPEYYLAHLIAGAANYGLGNYEQANSFLSRYIGRAPNDHHARKLLGLTQLRLRRASAALATLQPLSENLPDDPQILNLIATAAVGVGDLTTATAYYQKALIENP
ncbi:MAG: tetratricopeptide repeat protein, partial [Rhodospirillaceae bacterium]|nr:tetratricopeptide repeat protein [Rhodospirillaceae bacterium]